MVQPRCWRHPVRANGSIAVCSHRGAAVCVKGLLVLAAMRFSSVSVLLQDWGVLVLSLTLTDQG